MNLALVRISQLTPFVDTLDELGLPSDRHLEEVGLHRDALAIPETLVPRSQVWRFAEEAIDRADVSDLGLRAASRHGLLGLGPIGHRIRGALTLHHALGMLTRELRKISSHIRFRFEASSPLGWLSRDDVSQGYREARAPEQHSLILMLDVVRSLMGTSWYPEEIRLHHSLPRSAIDELGLGQSRILDGGDSTSISIPIELLPLAMPTEAARSRAAQDRPMASRVEPPTADILGLAAGLRHALKPILGRTPLTIHRGAEIAEMSVRTLQRQLAEEDSSWTELVTRVRFEESITRLADPTIKLSDLALELGYSDAAHFSRAFRRWTGSAPASYRKNLRSTFSTTGVIVSPIIHCGPKASGRSAK